MSITNVDNQVFKVHIYVYISHFNKKKERKKIYENPVYWLGKVHARDNGTKENFIERGMSRRKRMTSTNAEGEFLVSQVRYRPCVWVDFSFILWLGSRNDRA